MFDLQRVKNIHLVGIGGCGMSGLAKILFEMGCTLTGSDLKEGPNTLRLKELGIKVAIGHSTNCCRSADLVVFSSAIPQDNIELQEAKIHNLPILKRAEMLSWIINQSKVKIAIAGTHGKTTTTAMIAKVLDFSKLNPTYFIGCDMDYIEGNAHLGNGKFAVTEADESDSSFLFLSPTIEVITNIEADHLEHFGSLPELVKTFTKFINRLPQEGLVILDGDDVYNRTLISQIHSKFITYGFDNNLDWCAKNLRFHQATSTFTLFHQQKEIGEVELHVPGKQNTLNSLAVFALGGELGLDFSLIAGALRTFIGAKRRFQILGEIAQVMLVDDYAHHPTEIKATLSAAKSGWPGRRIVAIFQPHRYTRTAFLKEEFGKSFSEADKVIITEIYGAEEKPIPGVSGKTIADEIKGKDVVYIPRKEKIAEYLMNELKGQDLIITLGAGDIYTVGKEIFARLRMKDEISP